MKPNKTLTNAQDVITVLAERGPLLPAAIATATGVARSSVYRLTEGLVTVGLATILPDSRVQLSNRWLHLADAVLPGMQEWSSAQTVLDGVAADTGQTAYLSVLRGDRAVCIAWAQGRGIDLLVLKPGRTLPLYAGGAGRNILAHTPQCMERVLTQAPFSAFTPHTLTEKGSLRADVEQTLASGHTLSDEDVTIGIGAIGVAVRQGGQYLGCLSIGGLIDDIRADLDRLVARVQSGADRLAAGDP